ncbi:hypothetical protein MAL1_00187 [Bacteriophage DSS3_MAL1]|nr:hypothetical protein MAL1_00187 [Bacteriophage DSS3_MAL1]
MTFWRKDEFEQPSVGGEEFSKTRLADGGIVRDKPVPRSGVRVEPPMYGEAEGTTTYWLEGFHRASGQWVKLARFEGEEAANKAITDCHSKTQPDREKLSVVWDDFSAFRAEMYVTMRWMR